MKKIFKILSVTLIASILFSFTTMAQDLEVPSDTYTYWFTGSGEKIASVNSMYDIDSVITSSKLGISTFGSVDDVYSDDDGYTYILDGKNSEIIILDKSYKFVKKIKSVEKKDGSKITFVGAKSIYAKGKLLYICDTENERVLLVNKNGKLVDQFLRPTSSLIPEDFAYKPVKVFTDSYGYVYILCDGSYYGALLFNEKYEFMGFFGANTVKSGVLGSIQNAFNRMFINNTKKAATVSALPYVFSDLYIDEENFVYTSTGYTKGVRAGQIRKLNPGGGANVLKSDDVNFVDYEVNKSLTNTSLLNQDILSLEVDDYGFIYALDSAHGKIFVYNQDCWLVSAFGGGMHSGQQQGTFVAANALTLNGTDILVSDATKKTITVFSATSFGEKLLEAGYLSEIGEFKKALPIWQEVLSADANCSFAYSGIATALLKEGDYQGSMDYAKQGYDRVTYALAFKEVRDGILEKYFALIIIGAILLVGLIIAGGIYLKVKKLGIKNEELKFLFQVPMHPSKSFYKIQEKKLGSIPLCIILLAAFYVSSILKSLFAGFSFSNYDPALFNSIQFLVKSVGIIVLWIIVNWAISTIFGGRGKISEIAVVTCYSLTPMIVGNLMIFVFSNILIPEEGAFLSIAYTVLTIYTLLLIVIGTITIHDYDVKSFLGTTLLTLIGIAIVIFLMIMIILLVQQLWVFFVTIATELAL